MKVKGVTEMFILNPRNVKEFLNNAMERDGKFESEKEHFWAIGLDTRNKVKYVDLISVGTINYNLVHPIETYRLAVMERAVSVILVHNHPSGCLEPSDEDLSLTKRLVQAGKILGLEVLDHVIISPEGALSFKQKGLL